MTLWEEFLLKEMVLGDEIRMRRVYGGFEVTFKDVSRTAKTPKRALWMIAKKMGLK